jgi:hypothetical protein
MSLTNTSNAANIKSFVAACYPRQLITISTVYSGNVKSITFISYISRLEVTGATPVKKSSIAALSTNNDWYHDRANNKLYYYTTSASIDVVAVFGFFFKTGDSEPFHVDINDSTTDLVFYDGRMQETSFVQSIDDISSGVLSISSSSISLINNDGYYQTLASDSVTFKNSDIHVSIFYNNISNNALVFVGSIESATFNGNDLLLEVKDNNKKLQNLAKFTDVETEYKITTTRFGTDISSEIVGEVIPFVLGRLTSFEYKKIKQTLNYKSITEPISDAVVTNPTENIYYSDVYESNDIEGTDAIKLRVINRETVTSGFPAASVRCAKFVAFRSFNKLIANYILETSYAAIVDKRPDAATSTFFGGDIVATLSDMSKLFIGQSVNIYYSNSYNTNPNTGIGWGSRISEIDYANNKVTITPSGKVKITKNFLSNTYTFIKFLNFRTFYIDSEIPVGVTDKTIAYDETNADGTYTTFFQIDRYSGDYDLGYLDQYYYIGGDAKILIRGGVMDQYTELNSSTIELKEVEFGCKALTASTNISLGAMLHFTLKKAGYITDGGSGLTLTESTSSFKDLDTKLGTTYFTLKSTDGETYLDILQKMLSSVFGFLYIQADGKMGVRLFEKEPYSYTTWNISEDDIVNGSISSDFICSDICSRLKSSASIIRYNPIETKTDSKILLHGDIEKSVDFYIESASIYETKIQNRKYAYYSNAVRQFNFIIINNGYDILIGDKIMITFTLSNKWLGTNKEYELFVTSVNKSLLGTSVTAIENIFPEL